MVDVDREEENQVKCDQIREYNVLRLFRASNSEGYSIDGFRAGMSDQGEVKAWPPLNQPLNVLALLLQPFPQNIQLIVN